MGTKRFQMSLLQCEWLRLYDRNSKYQLFCCWIWNSSVLMSFQHSQQVTNERVVFTKGCNYVTTCKWGMKSKQIRYIRMIKPLARTPYRNFIEINFDMLWFFLCRTMVIIPCMMWQIDESLKSSPLWVFERSNLSILS